jgi:1-acyl-sn-glycerol-3-phosphate acyltransferase
MKRPNPFLYVTLGFLLKVFAIIKGQRIIKKIQIKGPAITLSNHTSFYDFIYTTAALYPKRVSYLAASKMFFETGTGFFLRLARAIPKSLMQADPVATLSAFRILKKKGIVSIFPEGQISPSGKTIYIAYSIAKFIKRAHVDVYIVRHFGPGLVNPPWTKKTFSGKIETEKYLLLNKEDIETMDLDYIYDVVCQHLHISQGQFAQEKGYRYRLRPINNLENVIYQCPECLHEGLVAKQYALICPSCHHELHYDVHGLINQEPLDVHFDRQAERVQYMIDQNPSFELSATTRLHSFRHEKLIDVGRGVMTLNHKGYVYQGTVDEKMTTLTFGIDSTPTLPSDIGRNIQIYEGYQIYQFEMDEPWKPTKFVHAGEYLYQIKQKS